MDDNREQLIRTKAFYIWLDEGCPEGRAEPWQMATELAAAEVGRADLAAQPGTNQPRRERRRPERHQNRGKRRENQGVGRPLAVPCARQRRQSHQ